VAYIIGTRALRDRDTSTCLFGLSLSVRAGQRNRLT
jgi:hypothetical protein